MKMLRSLLVWVASGFLIAGGFLGASGTASAEQAHPVEHAILLEASGCTHTPDRAVECFFIDGTRLHVNSVRSVLTFTGTRCERPLFESPKNHLLHEGPRACGKSELTGVWRVNKNFRNGTQMCGSWTISSAPACNTVHE